MAFRSCANLMVTSWRTLNLWPFLIFCPDKWPFNIFFLLLSCIMKQKIAGPLIGTL